MLHTNKKGDRRNLLSLFIRKAHLVPFLYLILAYPALCRADTSVVTSRDTIIQKQMDCVSRNLKNTGIGWQDLCYMTDASTQDQSEKQEAVNHQLDMVENSGSSEKPKEFSNSLSDNASVGAMLKEIFNPDLSQNPQPKTASRVKTRVHSLDAGVEIQYYQYQEPSYQTIDNTTETEVKNRGPMYGFYADYAYRPPAHNLLNNPLTNVYFLQARFATSRDLEYSGTGIIKHKHDDVDEIRGLIGKDYFIGADSMVTPYFGFGYRYLFDRGNNQITSNNAYAYDRKSHYYYIPLGANVVIDMADNWEIDPNLEYDLFITGLQKSFLSDGNQYGNDNGDLVNRQNSGYGVRASVKILKKGPLVDFYVEPYIRYWGIEQSKVVAFSVDGVVEQLVEPNNNTIEIGTKFGVQF